MATNALTPQGEILAPAAPPAGRQLASVGAIFAQPAFRKSVPLLAALGLAGAAALAWSVVSSPPQKILFSGLSDTDKGAVSEALSQANIDNTVDPQTGTLTVGQDDYYRARMLLATKNLPAATPGGYAILDELPMGVSRAVEGERLRQARETELARSIEEIDAVTEARVHLAMPENTVFVRDSASPSASVIVRLGTGRSLGDAQVRSIINLVASSVPGMKTDAVTIVDGSGQLLTGAGGDAGVALGDERIDFQRRVEAKYRDGLTQLLTPLLGAGNFSTEVQAEVDLDESQATRERFDSPGALRAEQGNWTADQNSVLPAGGIPGALSNTPPPATEVRAGNTRPNPVSSGPQVAEAAKISDQYARSYELDKEISVTREMPGAVRRLSVAVVIREAEGAKARTPQEIQQLTELVRAAVGFDQTRNDQVTIVSRPFASNPDEVSEGPAWHEAGWVALLARNLTALVIALLILFLGVRPLVAAILKRRSSSDMAPAEGGAIAGPPREPVSIEMLDSARSYDDKVTLVRDFTRDNPARAALAVRDMIRADGKAAR